MSWVLRDWSFVNFLVNRGENRSRNIRPVLI